MRFTPGTIDGLWVIDPDPISDNRGFFARSWCRKEFADHGLDVEWAQSNLQFSPDAGTIRGLHYQVDPHAEVKLVRCTSGAAYDVAVDVRPDSPSYLGWFGTELRAETHRSVWVPEGFAHGYLTLTPDTEVFYLTNREYAPDAVRAIRYDDPAVGIDWPRPVEVMQTGYDEQPFLEVPETG